MLIKHLLEHSNKVILYIMVYHKKKWMNKMNKKYKNNKH